MKKGLDIRGRRVLVVGLGRSGRAAAAWLSSRGARVTAGDLRAESDFAPGDLEALRSAGIGLELGGHDTATFVNADLIVVSPGVPLDIAPLRAAGERGTPVLGEMELACRFLDLPMAGVTGTNGKSTVTELTGEMLRAAGRRVFVGGNIGTPLVDLVREREAHDCGVIEVSSFQLDTLESFQPEVSVILNVSPDHLDRYEDYEAYVQSKLRIFRCQRPGGGVVLNDDDPRLRSVEPDRRLRVLRYGREQAAGRSAWLSGDRIMLAAGEERVEALSLDRFALPGRHNRENAMAAALAARFMGAGTEAVQEALDTFRGLSHRLELVCEGNGVAVYDDSKATNVDAAVRAVETFERPLVLIAGGRHKGGDYAPLVQAARGRAKAAVLLGEASSLLAEAFRGRLPCFEAESMEEAVSLALARAERGDAVLLAPACSSFDMFTDYAHRGRVFAECARRLTHGVERA